MRAWSTGLFPLWTRAALEAFGLDMNPVHAGLRWCVSLCLVVSFQALPLLRTRACLPSPLLCLACMLMFCLLLSALLLSQHASAARTAGPCASARAWMRGVVFAWLSDAAFSPHVVISLRLVQGFEGDQVNGVAWFGPCILLEPRRLLELAPGRAHCACRKGFPNLRFIQFHCFNFIVVHPKHQGAEPPFFIKGKILLAP